MVNRQMNNLISIDSFVSGSNVRVSFDHSPPPSPTTPAAFPTSSLPRGGPHNRLPSPLMTERRRMSPRLGNVYWRHRCLNLAPIRLFWRVFAICVCLFLPRLFTEPQSYGCARASRLWPRNCSHCCAKSSHRVVIFFSPPPHLCSGRAEGAWQTGGGWIERSRTNKGGEKKPSRWVMLGWEEEEGEKDAGMESGRENLGESWKQKTVTGIKGHHAEQEWRLNEWQQSQENIKK